MLAASYGVAFGALHPYLDSLIFLPEPEHMKFKD